MKRILRLGILMLCILIMNIGVVYAELLFSPTLEIDSSVEGIITVTIANELDNEEILATQKPSITVACAFSKAHVEYDGNTIPSTLENGEITFVIEKVGDYVIIEDTENANGRYENSIKILAGNTVSDDSNGYMTLANFSGEVYDGEWINHLEYDGTENRGSSRLSFKVDKEFISDDDNYYDIEIEYFDAGIGVILLQSSTDEKNTINYAATGYGGYPEEAFWTWSDGYYYANISVNLTNTLEWKTQTFRVTDEFFTDNVDNYIHFYFGRDKNFNDTLRMKSMTLTKRVFKIDSIDENSSDNKAIIGNLYTSDDFGMGFKVYNTSDESQLVTVSYKILDSQQNVCYEEDLGVTTIASKEDKKYYIQEPETYGTYILLTNVTNGEGIIEEEKIEFSKMVADLSNEINSFLGVNNFFGYSGWTNEEQIDDVIVAGMKLGIDDMRTNVNAYFLVEDANTGYTNELGRYEATYDIVYDTYGQKILFTMNPNIYSSFEETRDEIIEVYEAIAREYGDKIEYYEILNEVNLVGDSWGISAEQYAEIIVKANLAIRKIDSDAKIVAIDSNRIPIYVDNNYSTYSIEDSWVGRVLKTKICIDDVNDVYVSPIEIVDVISVHPYGDEYTTSPESYQTTKPVVSQLIDLRNFIEEYRTLYNIEKEIPIWITEVGYQTSVFGGVTEEQQASYLSRILIWSLANKTADKANIEKVYVYCLQDTGFSNTHPGSNYGMMNGFKTDNLKGYTRDVEMSAKKSYIALNNYSYLLNEAKLIDSNEDTSENDGYYWYEFEDKNGQTVIAVWNNDETVESQKVTFDAPKGKLSIYDMYGNKTTEFINGNETVEISISYKPMYIVVEEIPLKIIVTFDSNGGSSVPNYEYESFGLQLLNPKIPKPQNPTRTGYTFVGWYKDGVEYDFDTTITESVSFTLVAKWTKNQSTGGGGGGSTTTKYTITVKQNENGKITPETTKVEKGDDQKFEIKADKGYEIENVIIDGKSMGTTTEYTFENVKEKHTIEATFKKIEETVNEPIEEWKNPFADITENDWYYDAVKFVNENKLFNGVSSTEFGANVSMTRAMLVTVLYRLDGEPSTNKSIPFADVDMSMYYANAVIWAKQHNIVNGVDEINFAPDGEITREQLATVLYRYAKYKGENEGAEESSKVSSYDDFSEISEYAISAIEWACRSGIITGRTTSTIAPKGTATRAEVATMIMRFIEK